MALKQTQWTRSYNERAYARVYIMVPKSRKEAIEQFAREHDESVNGMVNRMLREAMGMTEDEWRGQTETRLSE